MSSRKLASNTRSLVHLQRRPYPSTSTKVSSTLLRRRELLVTLGTGIIAPLPSQAAQFSEEAYRKGDAVKRITKLFFNQRFDILEEITAPDAFVYVQGPSTVPYAGKYIGSDCVQQFWTRLTEVFTVKSVPEIYNYVNESGSVFVAFDIVLESVKDSGTVLSTSMAMKVKVDDDLKLTKIALISDTLAAYLAIPEQTSTL